MSHTNSTANYQLPQFLGTDKPAWLTDVNQAYADIDTAMKANEVSAGQANALATQNASAISTQSGQISTLSTKVTALETAQPVDEAQIETNRQNIATNAQNLVDLDNRMGHTDISSIGDGTATGAIADLNTQIGNIPTVSDMTGATASANGTHGLVPAPQAGDENKVLKGDGTWGVAGDNATVRYDPVSGYIQYTTDGGTTWINLINTQTPIQLLPVMTSNTSSVGTASHGSNSQAYQAIDGSGTSEITSVSLTSTDPTEALTFMFNTATYVKYLKVNAKQLYGDNHNFAFEYTSDGTTWLNAGNFDATSTSWVDYTSNNINNTVLGIRVRRTAGTSGNIYLYGFEAWG